MKKLTELFKENVTFDTDELMAYSTDASQIKGQPIAVVWPTDVTQLQKLVQLAYRNKYTLVPRGAGTGLAGGSVPQKAVVVDMSRMDRIESINVRDKKVTVQPGVIINDLNEKLDHYDLFFPVLPASYTTCQIGGIIATNAVGTRALKFGKACDWVQEVRMVDGSGKLVKIRPSDVCGTEGILGIIVEATLKVTEHIPETSLTLRRYNTVKEVVAGVRDFTDGIAVEFIDKTSSEMLGLEPAYHLFYEYEGEGGEITDQQRIEELWRLRERLGPLLSAKRYMRVEDPKIPLDKMDRFITWLTSHKIPTFGHIGVGILHPRFRKEQEKLIKQMFEKVTELGGSVTGEHGIGLAKKQYVDKKRIRDLTALKERYDPEYIFNKGKIYDQCP
ncbi:MAG: FAD-binding oxidoreductase [Nanobdellota archaeon]